MWGTVFAEKTDSRHWRFIPTHVGNGLSPILPYKRNAVHPHACGERLLVFIRALLYLGSSPRMWGTAMVNNVSDASCRFIPTHVGNGTRALCSRPKPPVHPHACGERAKGNPHPDISGGSSPRMWGTVEKIGLGEGAIRFIPTHVGNGELGTLHGILPAVHPHACGERYSGWPYY